MTPALAVPPVRPVPGISIACVALALALVAACSGSPGPTDGVASLGSPGTGTGAAAAGSRGGSGGQYQHQLAYSQCMRAHGLADFPDPQLQADGSVTRNIEVQKGSDLDPGTPRFQAAEKACQSLVPAPQAGQRTQQQQAQAQALQYAQCMRAHGVSSFPDPDFSHGIAFSDNGTYDPNAPSFLAADHACGSLLSGAAAGGAPDGAAGPGTAGGTARPSGSTAQP
jgi:hypothetical protein